ncbi:uncharacterized protein LOC144865801 [Branchiostoma floridae x Branchiostoma japonicum]
MAGNPMMLCGILILMVVGDCALGAPTILHNERLSLDGWTDTQSPFVPCKEDQECGHNFKCSATSWYQVDGDFPRICVPKTPTRGESNPPAFVTNLMSPGEPGRYNLYYCYYDKECPTGGVCKWVSKLASGICLYPDSKFDFTEFAEPPQHRSAPSKVVQYCSTNDECSSGEFCLNEEWMTNLGYLDYGVCMPKGYKYGPENFPVHFQSEPTEVQHRQGADPYQRQTLAVGNALPEMGDPNSIIYCHSDVECPSGQYCLFGAWEGLFGKFDYGVCMPRRPAAMTPCTMSSQCPQDEYCSYEGLCKSMFSNQQMASGQVAAAPQAQPVPQAQPRVHYCKSSTECTVGEYCLMRPESWKKFGSFDYGVCMPRVPGQQAIPQPPSAQNPPVNVAHARCSSFAECRTGEYCSPDGRCLPMFINQPLAAANMDPGAMGTDPSQGPSKVIYCKGNNDCPVGGKCVRGEWTQFGRFDYGVCMPKDWRPSLTGHAGGGNLMILPQSSDPRSAGNQAESIKYCSQDNQCGFGEVCLHGAWTEMGNYNYGVCMPMNTGLRSAADDATGHLRQSSDPGNGNVICTVCKDDNDCHSQDYCTAYLGSDDGLCWPRQGGPTPPKVPGSTICKQMTADSAKRCNGDRDCPVGQYCNTFLLSLSHQEGVCIPKGDAPAVVPPAQYQPVPQDDDSTLCNLCKTDQVCGSGFYCTAYLGSDDGVCWPRQGFGLLNVIPGKTVCKNGAPDLGLLLPAQAQPVATVSTPLGKVRCKLCTSSAECLSSEYCTAYKGTDQGLCWPNQGPLVPENLVPGVDLCSGSPDFKMCKTVADCNKETEYCTAYKGDDTGVCYPRLASIPSSGSSGSSAPSGSALEAQAQPVAVIGEASSLTSVTGSAFACKLCSADGECDSSEYCTAYKGSDKGLCWPKAGVPGPPNPIPGQSFCNYFGGGGDGDGGDGDGDGTKPSTEIRLCKSDNDCKVKEYCTAYLGNDKGVCWPVAVAAAQVPVAEIQFQPVDKPDSDGQGDDKPDKKPASSTLCKLCKKQDACAIDEYCTAYLGDDEGICWPKINAPAFFPGISICPVKTTTPQLCKSDSECKEDGKYCTAFMGTDWGVCFPKEGGAMYKQDQPMKFEFEALVIDPEALAKSRLKEVSSSEAESDGDDDSDYFDTDKFLQKLVV